VKVSVITPNLNGDRFLEEAVRSVALQKESGIDVEYIIVDGGSTDSSFDIIERYSDTVSKFITLPKKGPAAAINKGLQDAEGDILCWLNGDDRYLPGAFIRVSETFHQNPAAALCFGHCPIIDENGYEIRKPITKFKELFFPFSSVFLLQTINYISQPAMFFTRTAYERTGSLCEEMRAAWDYDFILRLMKNGNGVRLRRPPVAVFRWRKDSISGKLFRIQFKEEWEAAARNAGKSSIQSSAHFIVCYAIIGIYSLLERRRRYR